jgi:hypothetical protein
VAEIFLHHRVLILPVIDGGRVAKEVTASDDALARSPSAS